MPAYQELQLPLVTRKASGSENTSPWKLPDFFLALNSKFPLFVLHSVHSSQKSEKRTFR